MAVSVAVSASGVAVGSGAIAATGTDVTMARPWRPAGADATGSGLVTTVATLPAGEEATGTGSDVITVRPPSPGLTLIRPTDDQRERRRRTLEALHSQSRASAAVLVSVRAFPTSHASASLSERARIGTTFASDVAVIPTVAPLMSRNHYKAVPVVNR